MSEFEVHQCSSHADCDVLARGVYRCDQARCVEGCADNAHCAAADPRHPLCQYPGGACVGLSSEAGECYVSSGYSAPEQAAHTLEDLSVIGAFTPTVRSSYWLTLELAVAEINGNGGLNTPSGSRSVVAVACDPQTSALDGALEHLVVKLRTPAILASLEAEALRAALDRPVTSGRALFLSPEGAEREPEPADSNVWYLGPDAHAALPAYRLLVTRVEEALVSRGRMREQLRIAHLVSGAREDQTLASAVAAEWRVAGSDSALLERQYRFISFSPAGLDSPELDELAAFAPDIVLAFVGGAFPESPFVPRASLIEELERRAEASSGWRPAFVLGPRLADDQLLQVLAENSAAFRAHALGVRSDRRRDAAREAALAARFHAAFPAAALAVTRAAPVFGAYEALYYLAHAQAAASRSQPARAEQLLSGLERVTDGSGRLVEMGPGEEGLALANQLLAQGLPLQLQGVSGPLEFEPGHARSGAARVYCWRDDASVRELAVYDAAAVTLVASGEACGGEVFDGVGN